MTDPDPNIEAERQRKHWKHRDEERQSLRLQGAVAAFAIAGFGYFWFMGGLGNEVADLLTAYIPAVWAVTIEMIAGAVMIYMMWIRTIYDVDGREERRLQRIIDKINKK